MAGLGPMYVMSMASAKSASEASVPVLKVLVSSVTLSPRCSSKIPLPTPTRAVACVTLGK